MNFLHIYENVYHRFMEASKERFIKQIWAELEDDPESVMSQTNYRTSYLPSAEAIIKWTDSGAADTALKKANFNWQNFAAGKDDENGVPLYVVLLNAYFDYKSAGGSRKDRKKFLKQNPYEIFKQSGLKTVGPNEDNSDADMVLLTELENENFIFVVPLTYEACKFMNSFECGGEGAKWCIGYEKSDAYFREHTEEGKMFILAYRKGITASNELKYMISLTRDGGILTKAWTQEDDENKTIPSADFESVFGWKTKNFISAFDDVIIYKNSNIYSEIHQHELDITPSTINYYDYYNFYYGDDDIRKILDNYGELVVNFDHRHYFDFDLLLLVKGFSKAIGNNNYTVKLINYDFTNAWFESKPEDESVVPNKILFGNDGVCDELRLSKYASGRSRCIITEDPRAENCRINSRIAI